MALAENNKIAVEAECLRILKETEALRISKE
jgi:hypothetical protein